MHAKPVRPTSTMFSGRANMALIGVVSLIAKVAQAQTTVQDGMSCWSGQCIDVDGVGWYNPYGDFPSYSGGTTLSNVYLQALSNVPVTQRARSLPCFPLISPPKL